MNNYEGMFLLDSAQVVKDLEATEAVVTGTLERYGAKMLLGGKWDERKLAYPIKRQKRGTYFLAYFQADGDAIRQVRRDLQLKEEVLRFLILAMPEETPVPETIEVKKSITEDERGPRGGGRFGGGDRGDRGGRGGDF